MRTRFLQHYLASFCLHTCAALCLAIPMSVASQTCQDVCFPLDVIYDVDLLETPAFDQSTSTVATSSAIPARLTRFTFGTTAGLDIYQRFDEGRSYLVNLTVDPQTGEREVLNCIPDVAPAEPFARTCVYENSEIQAGASCSVRDEQVVAGVLPVQNQVVTFPSDNRIQLDIRFIRLGEETVPLDVYQRGEIRQPFLTRFRNFRPADDLSIFEPPDVCERP